MGCVNARNGAGGCCRRRVSYFHKLPEAPPPRDSGGSSPRAWGFLRRTVARTVGFYVRRRRWVAGQVRRVRWVALWAKVRGAVGLLPPSAPAARRPARYDLVSYSQNFDDGKWKEEEEVYWRSGSFARRFGQSGRFSGELLDSC